MAWSEITIGTGKNAISAFQRDDVVATTRTSFKVEDKIVLNGVSTPVLSYELDDMDDLLLITYLPICSKNN